MREKVGLTFPLYSDPDRSSLKAWGVHDAQNDISRPAVFIVNPAGEIVYEYVGKDKTDRPTLEEILTTLRNI